MCTLLSGNDCQIMQRPMLVQRVSPRIIQHASSMCHLAPQGTLCLLPTCSIPAPKAYPVLSQSAQPCTDVTPTSSRQTPPQAPDATRSQIQAQPRPKLGQMTHDGQIVVGFDGVANDRIQPSKRLHICRIVVCQSCLAIQIEGALCHLDHIQDMVNVLELMVSNR